MITDWSIFSLAIILLTLITIFLGNIWILLGENWCWSLLGLKGLRYSKFQGSSTFIFLFLPSPVVRLDPKQCHQLSWKYYLLLQARSFVTLLTILLIFMKKVRRKLILNECPEIAWKVIFASFKIFPSEIIFVKHLEVYSLHHARAAHRISKVVLRFLCLNTVSYVSVHVLLNTNII